MLLMSTRKSLLWYFMSLNAASSNVNVSLVVVQCSLEHLSWKFYLFLSCVRESWEYKLGILYHAITKHTAGFSSADNPWHYKLGLLSSTLKTAPLFSARIFLGLLFFLALSCQCMTASDFFSLEPYDYNKKCNPFLHVLLRSVCWTTPRRRQRLKSFPSRWIMNPRRGGGFPQTWNEFYSGRPGVIDRRGEKKHGRGQEQSPEL